MVRPVVEPLAEYLRTVPLTGPRTEVYGNADAAPYPSSPEEVRSRIARHVSSPVLFQDQIEAMYAAGVRTFVEVGAGAALTGLVGQILGDREHAAVPLDRPARPGADTLHAALGELAVRGVALDLDTLWASYAHEGPAKEHEPRMTVKISGANCGQFPPPRAASAEPPPAPEYEPEPEPEHRSRPAPVSVSASDTPAVPMPAYVPSPVHPAAF